MVTERVDRIVALIDRALSENEHVLTVKCSTTCEGPVWKVITHVPVVCKNRLPNEKGE